MENVLTGHCFFCKVPYIQEDKETVNKFCARCHSPLNQVVKVNLATGSKRSVSRDARFGEITFHTEWPEESKTASIKDISPNGLGFVTDFSLDKAQVIKIESTFFIAVAKVAYCQPKQTANHIGAEFITVEFITN